MSRHPALSERTVGTAWRTLRAFLFPCIIVLVVYLLFSGMVAISTADKCNGPLHADNQFFPDPFPPQVHMGTAIWCCDDFSGELGSTNRCQATAGETAQFSAAHRVVRHAHLRRTQELLFRKRSCHCTNV